MTAIFPYRVSAALAGLVLFFSCSSAPSAAEVRIENYRSLFKAGRDQSGRTRIAIRQYQRGAATYYLLVDPMTLESSTATEAAIDFSGSTPSQSLNDSPFVRALDRHTAPPFKLQNHGAVHADIHVDGLFLTADMCPSRRPMETGFLEAVADLGRSNGRPVPIAIAMTGDWLRNHPVEIAWFKREINQGKLAVTWVNHSYTHYYDPKLPLERNFLLAPGTDFEREVLDTEVLMLENGLIPSPFFRFPGLVADGALVKKLRQLFLIPVGSDAWLAKGETPKKGSIILVHGNGNEPQGIKRVLPLLGKSLGPGLLPLRDAFAPHDGAGTGLAKE